MSTRVSPALSIRPIETWNDFLAAEELQREVWKMPDWRDAVPANLLVTIQKNSGLVLGAFDGERLVGFAFSFIGIDSHLSPPALKHCSHMLAVLPAYQAQRIGLQLKLKQRELTLAQGISLMTWTYDPLLALNANLNLVRLGAIARRYILDAYGEMTDGLNAGLASDRFEVEWWLDRERAHEHLAGTAPRAGWESLQKNGSRAVLQIEWEAGRWPHIRGELELDGPVLLVDIPPDLAALKEHAPELAREWRARTRRVFTKAFAAGYAATDFVWTREPEMSRAAYVLTREPA
jgi:predicted GNAT superfamily acetyltransferase